MTLALNDLNWCIKLIILTPFKHDFWGQKVKFLPNLSDLTISQLCFSKLLKFSEFTIFTIDY